MKIGMWIVVGIGVVAIITSLCYLNFFGAESKKPEIITVATVSSNIEREVAGEYHEDKEGIRDLHRFLVYSGLTSDDGSKMPLATVYYSPEQDDVEGRVTTNAHEIEFKAEVIESVSKDGSKTHVVNAWAENSYSSESKGKKFEIDLNIGEWFVEKPSKSFMWNINLNASMLASMYEFYPAVGLSVWSYGYTKKDCDWKFANIFVGATDDVRVGVSPVAYNIANHLPLINNVFLGPFIDTDFKDIGYGVVISIPF